MSEGQIITLISTLTTDPRWSHIESPMLLEFGLRVLDVCATTGTDPYEEQADAWATFDEHDACNICGAQVSEFNQITHYRWHRRGTK